MHNHSHDDHAPIVHEELPSYYEILEISIRELLVEKGLIGAAEVKKRKGHR